MDHAFVRNIPSITKEEQRLLQQKHIAVAGCGRVGGYILEYACRIGIREITVIDPDLFEDSDLNCEILMTSDGIGRTKAFTALSRAKSINPEVRLHYCNTEIDREKAAEILRGCDLVFETLDNARERLMLEDVCAEQNIFMVHGAVSGWYMQVMVSSPGSGSLHTLYQTNRENGMRSRSCLAFTPAMCAGFAFSQGLKLLCGNMCMLTDRLLVFDAQSLDMKVIDLKDAVFEEKKITVSVRNTTNRYHNDREEISEHCTVSRYMKEHRLEKCFVMINGDLIEPRNYETTFFEDRDEVTFSMI